MAKKSFYVCAGLLCLALAYHFGAASATAQSGATMQGASFSATPGSSLSTTFVVNRTLYTSYNIGGGGHWQIPAMPSSSGPIPGTSPIVATENTIGVFALLDNGDMYRDVATSWEYEGNLLGVGGPTPAKAESFGQLKVKYR